MFFLSRYVVSKLCFWHHEFWHENLGVFKSVAKNLDHLLCCHYLTSVADRQRQWWIAGGTDGPIIMSQDRNFQNGIGQTCLKHHFHHIYVHEHWSDVWLSTSFLSHSIYVYVSFSLSHSWNKECLSKRVIMTKSDSKTNNPFQLGTEKELPKQTMKGS